MNNGVLSTGKGIDPHASAEFTDYQLHVEFATPKEVKGDSQGRGNSGVFLNGKFEIQVLDSYQNRTYRRRLRVGDVRTVSAAGERLAAAGRVAGLRHRLHARRDSAAGGKLDTPAIVTVLHNGIVVHNATPFWGPTAHKKIDPYTPDNAKGPIALQDHGNPVRYRNIWIRRLTGEPDENPWGRSTSRH